MRLLMTVDTVGGVWSYALDLAGGLATLGVSTTLAVMGPAPTPDQVGAAQAVPGLQVIETGAGLDWLEATPAEVASSARLLAELARQVDPDIIHLNSPALAALAPFRAPVLGACHSCLATWWDHAGSGPLPMDFGWRTDMLARGYAACDALVAPSAAFAAMTFASYGVQPEVVHNSATPPCSSNGRRGKFVLTAGRLWDVAKNVATLDAAAALLDAPVVAAGAQHGPDGSSLALRHAKALGRLGRDELAGWMRTAPVFTSLSRYEPFGLAVLEAAQAGCALVLSDIPTFRELWDGAAVFVPADDPVAVAAALRHLLDDREHAVAMAEAAASRAGRYSTRTAAGQMLRQYRALLRQDVPAIAAIA